ncbi:MAG: pyridoxamine 5'-phosphate oxidase family protein [Cyanobacteria bacterium P01_E01_bin.6]
MKIRRLHTLHEGELLVQQHKYTPNELTQQIPNYINTNMPQQQAEFYAGLSYLPLAILDNKGRPWVSILVAKSMNDSSVGIKVSDNNEMNIVAQMNHLDPFIRILKQTDLNIKNKRTLFAGVGVDFSNRRRNKLSGIITAASVDSAGQLSLSLKSDEHLGNCPKYITIRSLEPCLRQAEVSLDQFDLCTSKLPASCKETINQASSVFLATKHVPDDETSIDEQRDMGLNHRGGAPGFVRVYEDIEKDADGEECISIYLVLPDYSGNRFYQSLGNIQTNKQVGLAIPDFNNGNMLYVTGEAENLFDEDAEELMPRVSLLTRIRVTGAVFIQQGLNLCMVSDEQLSPYNPPVKYLRQELEQMGHLSQPSIGSDQPLNAKLVSTQKLTESVSTFTFQLSEFIDAPAPGGFGVFDFSGILNSGYSHMNEVNPQMVNEDYIRTWTLSNAPSFDIERKKFTPVNQVSVTVKRKIGGLISNFLHDDAMVHSQGAAQAMELQFKGTGVGFSCFTDTPESLRPNVPSKMLWIAGGVGITPFMSMWDGILNVTSVFPKGEESLSTDIVLLFSGRDDDLGLLRHFLSRINSLTDSIGIRIFAYQSIGVEASKAQDAHDLLIREFPNSPLHIEQRRIRNSDFENIGNLMDREVFLCGPETLMKLAQESLSSLGGDQLKLHQESYFF